jgi:YD repeat-containing protein
MDDYESRRSIYICMLPDRGTTDPQAVQEPGWTDRVYTYSNTQAHAVTNVTSETRTNTYQYDANGNMTQRVENGVTWTMTYNAENRLASMTNGTGAWLFSYDGNGNRVSHLVTQGSDSSLTAYFMAGGYEVKNVGATSTVKKYSTLAGATSAMRTSANSGAGNGVMQYLLSDHLGSVVAVTDLLGVLIEISRYMPFVCPSTFGGAVRTSVGSLAQTDKSFTGQKALANTCLMQYIALMYDPWKDYLSENPSIDHGMITILLLMSI